jgi:flavin reductase (DIM6/NTAB) family NADH-FMN oxidoreductase RutF
MTSLSERDTSCVEATEFRHFMRGWATGVAVVTSALGGHPTGCTVNTFVSVSLAPPLLLVSLAHDSDTLATIRTRGRFAVNVLAWRQRQLAARFAHDVDDRFRDVPHRLAHGVPVIADVMAAAVCTLTGTVPVADHVLVLGRPLWCERTGPDDPVLFLDGRYQRALT